MLLQHSSWPLLASPTLLCRPTQLCQPSAAHSADPLCRKLSWSNLHRATPAESKPSYPTPQTVTNHWLNRAPERRGVAGVPALTAKSFVNTILTSTAEFGTVRANGTAPEPSPASLTRFCSNAKWRAAADPLTSCSGFTRKPRRLWQQLRHLLQQLPPSHPST